MSRTDEPFVAPNPPNANCECEHCTGVTMSHFKHMTPLTTEPFEPFSQLKPNTTVREDLLVTGSRKYGATLRQFQQFVRAADSGLRVEMLGQNYVAMSRNMYEELIARANPTIVTSSEFQDLTNEEIDELYKGIAS